MLERSITSINAVCAWVLVASLLIILQRMPSSFEWGWRVSYYSINVKCWWNLNGWAVLREWCQVWVGLILFFWLLDFSERGWDPWSDLALVQDDWSGSWWALIILLTIILSFLGNTLLFIEFSSDSASFLDYKVTLWRAKVLPSTIYPWLLDRSASLQCWCLENRWELDVHRKTTSSTANTSAFLNPF
jgi:hypothetical protein